MKNLPKAAWLAATKRSKTWPSGHGSHFFLNEKWHERFFKKNFLKKQPEMEPFG